MEAQQSIYSTSGKRCGMSYRISSHPHIIEEYHHLTDEKKESINETGEMLPEKEEENPEESQWKKAFHEKLVCDAAKS